MYKIGIIGDRETVAGFMAIGFAVFEAGSAQEAGDILKRLIRECDGGNDTDSDTDTNAKAGNGDGYAVIFITEAYAAQLTELIEHYSGRFLPSVTVLPDKSGIDELSIGMQMIKRHVETAVGADILFRE